VEVTLSGGEPSETNYKNLVNVLTILKTAGIVTKMLTNGNFFDTNSDYRADFNPVLDVVGYSVNTFKDVEDAKVRFAGCGYGDFKDKITVVTNFGKHNIWDFDKIAEVAEQFGCWQVQLTEGEGLTLPPNGIKMLRNMLKNRPKTVMADNLAYKFKCQAGKEAMGILADGRVVPCLSMRCWNKELENMAHPRLRDELRVPDVSILQAWETDPVIRDYRFGRSKACCRDCFEYPTDESDIEIRGGVPSDDEGSGLLVYGITDLRENFYPNKIFTTVYAVATPHPLVTMYGITNPNGLWPQSDTGTTPLHGVVKCSVSSANGGLKHD